MKPPRLIAPGSWWAWDFDMFGAPYRLVVREARIAPGGWVAA